MHKQISFVLLIISISVGFKSSAQIFDNYGFRTGLGVSNEYWDYTYGFQDPLDSWQDRKMGLAAHFYGEKKFNDFVLLRPELGYIQKGFIKSSKSTTFHTFASDVALKINPLASKRLAVKPYFIAGVRLDVFLSTSNDNIDIQKRLDEYSSVNVGGLLGLGILVKDMFHFDVEYNPNITKSLKTKDLETRDQYWGFTLGVNIRQILHPTKKKK